MQNLVISFNAIAPMFLLMGLGYILKCPPVKKHKEALLTSEATRRLNALVFHVLLPVLLFRNIYSAPFSFKEDGRLIAFIVAGLFFVFALSFLSGTSFEKEKQRKGVTIQALFRSNVVLLGVPIAGALFGARGEALLSVVCSLSVPIYNMLAVITLSIFSDASTNFKSIAGSVVKNPLIIASVSAFACKLILPEMPQFLSSVVNSIAASATPLALICLGASLHLGEVSANKKSLAFILSMRLVFIPMLCIAAALLFGFRGVALGAVLCVFASPVATSSFTMAVEMGGDSELAAEAVVFSTVFSSVTLFL